MWQNFLFRPKSDSKELIPLFGFGRRYNMALPLVTPIVCSLVTAVMVLVVLNLRTNYNLEPESKGNKRMFYTSIIVFIALAVGTVFAYLLSFEMI